MVLAWLVIAAVLLLFELRHLAFYALFGTVGCLGAAAIALLAPSAIALQGGVAGTVALVGVVTVRPLVSKAFASRRSGGHVTLGVHGGLVGQEAITLDRVGEAHLVGHVRLAGERWLAISGDGHPIGAQTKVLVASVQGTTLMVWPIDGTMGIPEEVATPAHDEATDAWDGRTQ